MDTTDIAASSAAAAQPATIMTPPNTDEGQKPDGDLSSLDLNEDDDDEEEVVPDHYWEGGKIPVFKPSMDQFRSFKEYIAKIDKYGMKSGIVKVIPPPEWRQSLGALDEAIKTIKVKNPITQEISGKAGTYTQANIEKQRSYNLPQWKALTEETQHQPPAKRGERRKVVEKAAKPKPTPKSTPATASSTTSSSSSAARPRGRPPKGGRRKTSTPSIGPVQEPTPSIEGDGDSENESTLQRPLTPTSPGSMQPPQKKQKKMAAPTKAKGPAKAKTISERRKYNTQDEAEEIDEEAFTDFDYRFYGNDEFTPERCKELEALYWKTLTYAAPMYGADMPGSLFDDTTTSWNVAKLENLLDVLGTKVPGVNTAYLYLGMWKATFAWHLEDVDLYSINYIHFGAPKQWYSISQEDARRFEAAMKILWPNDSKNCSQFLRHKTYLVSPTLLKEQFNIEVNRLVHYEGEFVITYPYGYHSGYNLGYNCAESVNFATEDWLEYGKIAKKCACEADSVWVDAHYIERKLKGEPSPEYYEETDEEDDMDEDAVDLLTPPASIAGKGKPGRKRKRESIKSGILKPKKKIKIRIRQGGFEPCALCPNNMPFEKLLPTSTGAHAHAICALYTPETYIWPENEVPDGEPQTVYGIDTIAKERLGLKCSFCRNKKGACFQCSSKKCTRAFHATCAAAAGVRVDFGKTPFFVEGGDEYWVEENDFRCRFHRPKRPKQHTGEFLENDRLIKTQMPTVKARTVIQAQFYQGDLFAGVVVENRAEEGALVVDLLPEGSDRIEVEYKWVLVQDPDDSQLPRPSAACIGPLPEHLNKPNVENRKDQYRLPQPEDPFSEDGSIKWGEFNTINSQDAPKFRKHPKLNIDMDKQNSVWYYLAQRSTDVKDFYTEDVLCPRPNPQSNFLDTVKPPPPTPIPHKPYSLAGGSSRLQQADMTSSVPRQKLSQTPPLISRYSPSVQDSRTSEWVHQMQQSNALSHIAYGQGSSSHSQPNTFRFLPHAASNERVSMYRSPYSSAPKGRRASVAENGLALQIDSTNTTAIGIGMPASPYRRPTTADLMEHLQRYPYLIKAINRRPRYYKSIYAPMQYQPQTFTRPTSKSMSSIPRSPYATSPTGNPSSATTKESVFVPKWVDQQQ